MSSPIRRPSMLCVSATTFVRSSTRGWSTCLRLNARSWRVSDAARSTPRTISSTPGRSGLAGGISSSSRAACPPTAVRMLLKSCAIPPASRPTASSFSQHLPELLLAPSQRLLRTLAVRDVTLDPYRADPPPLRVPDRRFYGLVPARRAVRELDRLLDDQRAPGLEHARVLGAVPRRPIGGPDLRVCATDHLASRPPARPREGVVHGQVMPLGRLEPRGIRDVAQQRLLQPLRGLQRLEHGPALGHLLHRHDHAVLATRGPSRT